MGVEPAPPPPAPTAGAAARLALVTLAAAAVVAGLGVLARERIARNEAAQVMKELRPLLAGTGFDNEPDRDRIYVRDPALLGSDAPLPVYRARRGAEVAAIIVTVVAPEGYAGPIRLLVAFAPDGHVLGVRVTEHRETPGLGDRIEADDSAWLARFTGRTLGDPEAARWKVRRDGGDFDQVSGATVTSRAVVRAVRDAGDFFRRDREALWSRPAQESPAR